MFDFDIREKTNNDLMCIELNSNAFRNADIIRLSGDKKSILGKLVGDFLLEKVEIDFNGKSFFKFEQNGDDFIGENLPIIKGIDSLIYHGSSTLLLNDKIENLFLDKCNKSIRISRLLSTFINKNDGACEKYFEIINHHLKEIIDNLNFAIKNHNKTIMQCAKQNAEYLHNLYINHPETIR